MWPIFNVVKFIKLQGTNFIRWTNEPKVQETTIYFSLTKLCKIFVHCFGTFAASHNN